ncbi:MAG: hypothetical protein V1750_02700, partial [Acidobacteriota bacterium]
MTLLAVILLLALAAAWWGAHRIASPDDYFAAGRRAGAWLVGVAGTAAAVSAFTFVGGPGLFAVAGVGSLWIILSAPLTGALQCWAVGEPVVELARRNGVLTPQELLGARFGRGARGAAALVIALGVVASLAVQAKAAAVLAQAFLNVPPLAGALVVMAATTAYTALGGMRAGLLADAVQGAVMACLGVGLAGAALIAAGGPLAAIDALQTSRPALLGSFGATPPAAAFAWFLLFALGTCAQPHYLQKFLFLRSPSQLRALPAVLTGALTATLAIWVGIGLAGTAMQASGVVSPTRPDGLMPAVMAHLGPAAVVMAAA